MKSTRLFLLASLMLLALAAAGCGKATAALPAGTPLPFVPPTDSGPLGLVNPAATPEPTATFLPLPTLDLPEAGPTAEIQAVPIEVEAGGAPASVQGTLPPGGMSRYVLAGLAGQAMDVRLALAQGFGLLVVSGADGAVLLGDRPEPTRWSGTLPAAQDYYLDVKGSGGSLDVMYVLTVTLSAP